MDSNSYTYSQTDRFLAYSFSPGTLTGSTTDDGMIWQHSVQVFPGIGLSVQDDIMLLYQARPSGPDLTLKSLYCLIRKGADIRRAQECIDLWLQTFSEDKDVIELQHMGIRSGRFPRARYMTCREPAAIFINKMILESYVNGVG